MTTPPNSTPKNHRGSRRKPERLLDEATLAELNQVRLRPEDRDRDRKPISPFAEFEARIAGLEEMITTLKKERAAFQHENERLKQEIIALKAPHETPVLNHD